MLSTPFRRLAVAALLAVPIGCASGGSVEVLMPVTGDLREYGTVELNACSAEESAEKFKPRLEAAVLQALRARKLFRAYRQAGDEGTSRLLLNLRIVAMHEVDRTARVMVGALAGRASLEVDVTLVEVSSARDLGVLKVRGHSSGGTVFAGTTEDAIRIVADRIADFLSDRMKDAGPP